MCFNQLIATPQPSLLVRHVAVDTQVHNKQSHIWTSKEHLTLIIKRYSFAGTQTQSHSHSHFPTRLLTLS